jgi:F-type H+-transporting ATPase subunit b
MRVFPILLLAVLVCAAPCRLRAQETAPAAQTSIATDQTAKSETAKPEANADEAQKNLFRLEGPIVKWTAHALNLSVEITADIFDFINFGVIVLLIGVPLAKVLPKLLRSRGEKVRGDLDEARKATAAAQERLSAIEAKLSGLNEEIERIREQMEKDSAQDEARIKSTIGEESARIVAAAGQEIASSAAQARRSLSSFAADLAIEQAVKQLKFTPEIDRALIDEFLTDAALKTADGGQK